jgi:2-oxo-3-hexenedioate decarboxylase
MPNLDSDLLAREFLAAYEAGQKVGAPPSMRDAAFDLNAAYAVEAEYKRLRTQQGRAATGRKVGFANKAMWRILKLDTLVWAHMYDDTVRYSSGNTAEFSLARCRSPKIEPEIVFKLRTSVAAGLDAAGALDAVEWIAIGFEIIDCPFQDWEFKPVDFVAAAGIHAALIVGEPRIVDAPLIPTLVEELPRFKLKLLKAGDLVEEGSGKNSLRSPALCLAELAGAALRQSPVEPLVTGELVSTGTLTTAPLISAGESWTVEVEGLPLPSLTVRLI